MGKQTTRLNHLRTASEEAKSYAVGLVSGLAQTVTDAMEELDNAKADAAAYTQANNAFNAANNAQTTADGKWTAVDATTSVKGITMLVNSVTNTSTAYAATPAAVRAAYSLASAANTLATTANTTATAKADKGTAVSFTIPTSGWSSDSTTTYSYYYDIAVSDITVSDRADVDIAPTSITAAVTCGLCPATETLAGKIRLRAVSVPTATMTAQYWIEKGA